MLIMSAGAQKGDHKAVRQGSLWIFNRFSRRSVKDRARMEAEEFCVGGRH